MLERLVVEPVHRCAFRQYKELSVIGESDAAVISHIRQITRVARGGCYLSRGIAKKMKPEHVIARAPQ